MEKQTLTNKVTVSDENFDDEVLESNIPVLVDFWAKWCAPCKVVGPTIEALASDYEGKVKFANLNIEDNPEAKGRFGVRSIPTLIVFKDCQAQQAVSGVRSKRQLAQLIEKYLH